MNLRSAIAAVSFAAVVVALQPVAVRAQVGKSQGVADINTMPESGLASLPRVTPEIAKALAAKRPFASIADLNAFLLTQGLTQEQANEIYPKAFVHINLNTATSQEILLVPGAGRRMTHEFAEYRPWKTWAQFDREIGKYVGADATARLAQYAFIPMNANTASDADLMTIPGADATLVQTIKQGRPYKTAAELEQTVAQSSSAANGRTVARFLTAE